MSSDVYKVFVVSFPSLEKGRQRKKENKLKIFILSKTSIKFHCLLQGRKEKIPEEMLFSCWWKIPQMDLDMLPQRNPKSDWKCLV